LAELALEHGADVDKKDPYYTQASNPLGIISLHHVPYNNIPNNNIPRPEAAPMARLLLSHGAKLITWKSENEMGRLCSICCSAPKIRLPALSAMSEQEKLTALTVLKARAQRGLFNESENTELLTELGDLQFLNTACQNGLPSFPVEITRLVAEYNQFNNP
jgi:hypothetical protein